MVATMSMKTRGNPVTCSSIVWLCFGTFSSSRKRACHRTNDSLADPGFSPTQAKAVFVSAGYSFHTSRSKKIFHSSRSKQKSPGSRVKRSLSCRQEMVGSCQHCAGPLESEARGEKKSEALVEGNPSLVFLLFAWLNLVLKFSRHSACFFLRVALVRFC